MEGNAKIIRLIARDEALHLTGTQHMLNLLRSCEHLLRPPNIQRLCTRAKQGKIHASCSHIAA